MCNTGFPGTISLYELTGRMRAAAAAAADSSCAGAALANGNHFSRFTHTSTQVIYFILLSPTRRISCFQQLSVSD